MIISLVINLLKLANTWKLILNLHDSKSVIIKLEPANIFGWCYCIFCLRNVFKNRSIVKLVADQFSVFATSQIKLSRRDFHCFHVIQTTRETLQTSCSLLSKARPIVKFWPACFAQYMIYSINLDLEKQRFPLALIAGQNDPVGAITIQFTWGVFWATKQSNSGLQYI